MLDIDDYGRMIIDTLDKEPDSEGYYTLKLTERDILILYDVLMYFDSKYPGEYIIRQ